MSMRTSRFDTLVAFGAGSDGSPSESGAKPSVASLEQAAQWYATLRDEGATEQDHHDWRRWLAQAPEHAASWQHIEAVGRRFEPLRGGVSGGAAAAVAGVDAARRVAMGRRNVFNGLAGALGLGLAGWLAWRQTPLPEMVAALRADYRTGTGERRNLVLADGSRIWLNTRTAVQVDEGSSLHRLVLLAGEILVETAPGRPQRMLEVQTGFGRVQGRDTRFSARQTDTRTRLDVFDGAVEVRTDAGHTRRVPAGQAIQFDTTRIGAPAIADRVAEAWTRGRLPADNLPLGTLLNELARYRHGHIAVAPEVAGLKVMGVYPTDDTDLALAMLEQALPIRVRRSLPWWTTVEAR